MIIARKGTHQGSKHIQLGFNNQDSVLLESFMIPGQDRQFTVGLLSDGCTNLPGFSKSEVGASLLPVFAYGRCQELISAGLLLADIPRVLFQASTEFLRALATMVMPSSVYWGYPEELRSVLSAQKAHKDRLSWDSTTRFKVDYLSATLLGFITDGIDLVVFSAGDGTVLVNEALTAIDHKDKPLYPMLSINKPGGGFVSRLYPLAAVKRLVLASDGLEELMKDPKFIDQMFSANPGLFGLQMLLNQTFSGRDYLMSDDCTAIALVNLDYASPEEGVCTEWFTYPRSEMSKE